jgi:GTPase
LTSTPYKSGLPKIAIIGRPNVGKSTLYNTLLKKRKAITDPIAGVTRDANDAEFELEGQSFVLVDTGGISQDKTGFSGIVGEKSIKTAAEADLILLMVEVGEITGDDEVLIEQLRPYAERTFLIVNKVDTEHKDSLAYNLNTLGFKTTVPISASHRRNLHLLLKEIKGYFRTYEAEKIEKVAPAVRIAILGKPNTGKSTLINLLTGEETSLVSPIPGTTRDVVSGNFTYKDKLFQILDTAGIRRKTKVKEDIEYYSVQRAIKSLEETDLVFFVIDSLDGITMQDKKIVGLAEDRGRGIILVLNKWDILPPMPNRLEATIDRIHFLFPVFKYAPIIPLSAMTGWNAPKLLSTALRVWEQMNRRIETAKLNQAVQKWIKEYPVKTRGKVVRVKYATQLSVNPVRFVFFVNTIKAFTADYENFLANKIRKELGFGTIPLSLSFRKGADGRKKE